MPTTSRNPATNTYSFNEHKHRCAVWAAARAQRGFAKNEAISKAINATSLRSFAETSVITKESELDDKHREWCTGIIEYFGADKCKYGRAAKIVAIYLKTAVILPSHGTSSVAELIHPPIDKILLNSIAEKTSLKHFSTITWTTMDSDRYWKVVNDMRVVLEKCNWELETYWNLTDDE